MKFSIITATYNVAETLQDTIDSVSDQTYRRVEHIIVDGLSDDDTDVVIDKNTSALAQIVQEPDDGIYHAMNKGLALATGDVVGILNGDDFYADSHVLDSVMEVFKNPKIDAVYADLLYVAKNDTSKVVRYWTSQPYDEGLFDKGWIPAHPTFFVRREVYEKFGGFDLRYKIQSDFELCLRFLKVHKIRSYYLPRVLVHMRMGGVTNNSIKTILKGNIESYRACQQHGLDVTPWFFVKKWSQRVPQFFRKPVNNEMQRAAYSGQVMEAGPTKSLSAQPEWPKTASSCQAQPMRRFRR